MKAFLKRVLPPLVQDIARSLRDDRAILALPDRRFVETTLLPAIAASGAKTILYVGVRSYTRRYPDLLQRLGVETWTTDIDPVAARHGVKGRHRVSDVADLKPEDFPVRFDLVVFSGVIGFGVNSRSQIDAAARALAGMTAPGGRLVLGWNHDNAADPLQTSDWGRLFERAALPGIAERVRFDGATHVFDVLARR